PEGFDLVVTDYNMPGLSGLDVARAVHEIRAEMPVAIVSGFIDEAMRAEAERVGVREVIFKASSVEDFCEAFAQSAHLLGARTTSQEMTK
ncbi:MAG: response regulator, partial [Usitatibacteraceae bacterium]